MTTETRETRAGRQSWEFGRRALFIVVFLLPLPSLAGLACGAPLVRDRPHGDRDVRYCDRDGDLVAEWVSARVRAGLR